MRVLTASVLLVAVLSAGPPARPDANWPNWRGPAYNGSSPVTGLPVAFSPQQGVRWVADLPGPSAATPVIWGDYVFVSSTDPKAQQLVALCLDRRTGKVRWRQNAGSGYQPAGQGSRLQLDERSTYSAPSPVTDGRRVVFFFGNGDLVCFSTAGKRIWARNLQRDYGDFAFQWTFSSSPLLYEGRLYMQILQRNQPVGPRGRPNAESFLLALDPATGKEHWRTVRPSSARMESREAYSTPVPVVHRGRKEIVIAGGDCLTGHDPATGRELWRWETWNPGHREMWWRLVPSPVAGGGVVLACAPKRAPVYAASLGGSGDLGERGLAWRSGDRSPVTSDVPTPLFYKGRFFVLSDVRRALSCVNPADGSVIWTTELPSVCWGSPTGADGRIYCLSLRGEVFVVDPATGRILCTNAMAPGEDDIRSTIAAAQGALFIRTNTRLYCVGK